MKPQLKITLTALCLLSCILTASGQITDADKQHSPHKASIYSAILPGLGQAYNNKYFKIPIIYTGAGVLAYAIHFNSNYYKKYRSAYRDWIINDPNNKSYLEFIHPTMTEEQIRKENNAWFEEALKSKKQYYRRYRDLSYIGMTVLYALQIMDAAVDAHFFNFDVSDDLSLNIAPTLLESSKYDHPALGLRLNLRM